MPLVITVHNDGSATLHPSTGADEFLVAALANVALVGGTVDIAPLAGKSVRYTFHAGGSAEDNGSLGPLLDMMEPPDPAGSKESP